MLFYVINIRTLAEHIIRKIVNRNILGLIDLKLFTKFEYDFKDKESILPEFCK
jgi:hypothetical protein